MKALLSGLLMVCLSPACHAGASATVLLVQPILSLGDTDGWGENGFRIVDIPYISWYANSGPPFQAISQSNLLPTDAPRQDRQPESNLLAFYQIRIGSRDPQTNEVWLRLENAKQPEGWTATVEDAAYAALECIRILSQRHQLRPQIRISAPQGSEDLWSDVASRFNRHDFSKPFQRPAAQ